METNLVLDGTKFLFLGIGTVLAILFIMIIATNSGSKIINRFFPESKNIPSEETKLVEPQSIQDKRVIVAAIVAAIIHHRRTIQNKETNKKIVAAITGAMLHHTQG